MPVLRVLSVFPSASYLKMLDVSAIQAAFSELDLCVRFTTNSCADELDERHLGSVWPRDVNPDSRNVHSPCSIRQFELVCCGKMNADVEMTCPLTRDAPSVHLGCSLPQWGMNSSPLGVRRVCRVVADDAAQVGVARVEAERIIAREARRPRRPVRFRRSRHRLFLPFLHFEEDRIAAVAGRSHGRSALVNGIASPLSRSAPRLSSRFRRFPRLPCFPVRSVAPILDAEDDEADNIKQEMGNHRDGRFAGPPERCRENDAFPD